VENPDQKNSRSVLLNPTNHWSYGFIDLAKSGHNIDVKGFASKISGINELAADFEEHFSNSKNPCAEAQN
jgi:hypothetical protein